jgi:peptide deformylase
MGNPSDPSSIISVFNPKVVDEIGEDVYYDEGCLTFPGLFVRMKRNSAIRVRYTTYQNFTDTIKFDGMTARVFLHECDHLLGVLYTDVAKPYHLEKAKRKQKIYVKQKQRQDALL